MAIPLCESSCASKGYPSPSKSDDKLYKNLVKTVNFLYHIINLSAMFACEFVLLCVVDCLHAKLQTTFLSETLNSIHKV